jgi:putative peptidoglycan lipid II flippase
VLGQVWLWVRLGHLRSKRSLRVGLITLGASALGVGAAVLAGYAVPGSLGTIPAAWVKLPVQTLLGMAVPFGLLALLKLPEFTPVTRRVAGLLRRLSPR